MTVLDGAAEEPVVLGEITLPGVRWSVAHARTFLRDLLPCDHPILDDLVTVGSETVCNAVTHTASGRASGQVRVVLLAERGAYRLEVTDDGADDARPRLKPEGGGESGRGMRIVDALPAMGLPAGRRSYGRLGRVPLRARP